MKFVAGVIFAALMAAGAFGCTAAMRNNEIENCRRGGGQPITRPWYSDKWSEVSCIGGR